MSTSAEPACLGASASRCNRAKSELCKDMVGGGGEAESLASVACIPLMRSRVVSHL
jgi:hypothetical protein